MKNFLKSLVIIILFLYQFLAVFGLYIEGIPVFGDMGMSAGNPILLNAFYAATYCIGLFMFMIIGILLMVDMIISNRQSKNKRRWRIILAIPIALLFILDIYVSISQSMYYGLLGPIAYLFLYLLPDIVSKNKKPALYDYDKQNAAVINYMAADGSPPQIKFCRKCGSRLLPDSLFCQKCGTRVINAESVKDHAL